MKSTTQKPAGNFAPGATLIEAIIAVGVLAVAVPLVFGAMVESGKSSVAAEAETQCSWVIPACVNELQAASRNQSRLLSEIPAGKEFKDLSLAFSAGGKVLAKLDPAIYSQGTSDQNVRYIASMTATLVKDEPAVSDHVPIRQIRIRLEYPAAAPVGRRDKIDFYTRLP